MTTPMRQRFAPPPANPWFALLAMMIGFFMILVDSTIVAVANPTIMRELKIADYNAVIWVTSAYLLAYAVPLLLAGRLGDRYGPKNLYMIGLAVFTAASLWCGLAGSIETLIAARVVQGIGAGLLTPQTLSTITRIFPAERRGVAMSAWGATAGIATLVGPLAGGVLVDSLGWEWIFFVNVPIGVIGLGLAWWLVPVLPTQKHRFDLLGVLLSGLGMFMVVFGLQEGQSHDWALWIWATIASGVAFLVGFVYWQSVNKHEPLIPLQVFRDRDFSLANVGVAVIGFVVTAMVLPLMFFAQAVTGLSPTRSALLVAPMAIASGVLAPAVGKIVDRAHPRSVIGFGFSVLAIGITWFSVEMSPTTAIWRLVLPMTAVGVGMAFIWAPLAATATRNLPDHLAGAGSGVYNTTRQVGSVLGSAGIAAFMTSRISAEIPTTPGAAAPTDGQVGQLPALLREPFAAAMSQSMLLPAFVALFGVIAALFLLGFGRNPASAANTFATDRVKPHFGDSEDDSLDGYDHYDSGHRADAFDARTEVIPVVSAGVKGAPGAADSGDFDDSGYRRPAYPQQQPVALGGSGVYDPAHFSGDEGVDDDDYVEFVVAREDFAGSTASVEPVILAEPAAPAGEADEADTDAFAVHVEHPSPTPAEVWHSDPVESWRSLVDEPHAPVAPMPPPDAELIPGRIGFAHNGFHVDDDEHIRPIADPPTAFSDNSYQDNGHPENGYGENGYRVWPPTESEPVAEAPSYAVPPWPSITDYVSDYQPTSLTSPAGPAPTFPAAEPRPHRYLDDGQYGDEPSARHQLSEPEPDSGGSRRSARHYREEPDDQASHGRHSRPRHD